MHLAAAHPRTVRTPLSRLYGVCWLLVAPFRGLVEVLLVRGVLLGFTVSGSFLLSTTSVLALLVDHAGDGATLIPDDS
jgi:hypothetical protein